MGRTVLTFVITYDIASPTIRRRVARYLEERMTRVQLSVFEARMTVEAANRLFDALDVLIEDDDRLRMYALNARGLEKSRASGGAPLPEDGGWWLL
ncbi:MAG TPA: CRISPR-associated endonuclease Cas2 [Thermopetrobacter sp.]|nr:CRISPR-associated endonuclease Cas2 [Thermopetrobacter sp.]